MLSRDVMQMEISLAWFSVFQVLYEMFIDGLGGNKKNYLGVLGWFCQIYLVIIEVSCFMTILMDDTEIQKNVVLQTHC